MAVRVPWEPTGSETPLEARESSLGAQSGSTAPMVGVVGASVRKTGQGVLWDVVARKGQSKSDRTRSGPWLSGGCSLIGRPTSTTARPRVRSALRSARGGQISHKSFAPLSLCQMPSTGQGPCPGKRVICNAISPHCARRGSASGLAPELVALAGFSNGLRVSEGCIQNARLYLTCLVRVSCAGSKGSPGAQSPSYPVQNAGPQDLSAPVLCRAILARDPGKSAA